MATVQPIEIKTHPFSGSVKVWKWTGITEADVGAGVPYPVKGDKGVMVVGDFDASGAIAFEISLNPSLTEPADADYVPATDPQGNDMTFTAKKAEAILQPAYWYRPRATAGTAVVMDVYLICVGVA